MKNFAMQQWQTVADSGSRMRPRSSAASGGAARVEELSIAALK